MKKRNYFELQLILSMILITMGALLQWKGKNVVPGIPYILFIIPGGIILLSFFIDFIKLKAHWMYLVVYVVLYVLADVVVIATYKLKTSSTLFILIGGIMLLSVSVATIFHFIYDNLKHPKRLIRF